MTKAITATAVEVLSDLECRDYLRSATLGRLAVLAADGVDIFPMNFVLDGRAIALKTAPGSKLLDLTAQPRVAFEVDGLDGDLRWSVVVRGVAVRLADDTDIELSGVLGLHTEIPTEKLNYLRVTPTTMTGRRFRVTP